MSLIFRIFQTLQELRSIRTSIFLFDTITNDELISNCSSDSASRTVDNALKLHLNNTRTWNNSKMSHSQFQSINRRHHFPSKVVHWSQTHTQPVDQYIYHECFYNTFHRAKYTASYRPWNVCTLWHFIRTDSGFWYWWTMPIWACTRCEHFTSNLLYRQFSWILLAIQLSSIRYYILHYSIELKVIICEEVALSHATLLSKYIWTWKYLHSKGGGW